MGRVDPQDDGVARYVACYYRYDPERHERRNVIEAVYDNAAELTAHLNDANRAPQVLQTAGLSIHVSKLAWALLAAGVPR